MVNQMEWVFEALEHLNQVFLPFSIAVSLGLCKNAFIRIHNASKWKAVYL